MLLTEDVLDSEMMAKIVAVGHSRIPVYRHWPHNVCGIILVKKLIVLSPDDRRKISSLGLRYPLPVPPEMPLLELLNLFQRGMSHLAIVTNKPALVAECMRNGRDIPPDVHMDGIVTLEDILENVHCAPRTTARHARLPTARQSAARPPTATGRRASEREHASRASATAVSDACCESGASGVCASEEALRASPCVPD